MVGEPERYPVGFSKPELDLICKILYQAQRDPNCTIHLFASEWIDLKPLRKRLDEKSYEFHATLH